MAGKGSSSTSKNSKNNKSATAKKSGSSAGKSGKKMNVKERIKFSWKAFCAVLVSMVFLFGVHTFLEWISPEYGNFFRTQSEEISRKVNQTVQQVEEKFSPAPTITIAANAQNFKYDNLTVGVPTYNCDTIVDRVGYALGYSEKYEQPLWVAYKLTAAEVQKKVARRSEDFRSDPAIPSGSATPEDYKNSGYDRGHLAPAADMSFSVQAMSESFYMSNMSPQRPELNRGIWKDLEENVRHFAAKCGALYVVTGPIFEKNLPYITIGKNKVAVPDKYYKVLLDTNAANPKAIGFIIPNSETKADLATFAVTVDTVEKAAGMDFFQVLNDSDEEKLESSCNYSAWEQMLPKKNKRSNSKKAHSNRSKK